LGLPRWVLAGGLLIPGLLALVLLLDRRRRRSRLLDPDALIIRPEEHLVGRDDDIQNVSRLCDSESLIWLVGESGVGKSALLQAGLVPKLRTSPGKLPIFVDNWGSDWLKGPHEAVLNALRVELDAPTRQKLGLDSEATLEQIASALHQLREIRGLPILIFDQFDDYQARHRQEFVPESRGTLLTTEELANVNPFWRLIKNLLDQGAVHCLFTTRSDMLSGYGLECVRFCDPRVYPLARLAPGYALSLLEKLTAGDVVANPENGFDRLKSRLCRDMESGGDILPVRMKIIFRSLVSLRDDLTVHGYLKADGLAGLEALYIQRVVSETSRIAGLEEADLRSLLLALTDRSTGKTIPLTDQELLKILPQQRRDQRKLQLVLEGLESKEIVRKHLDFDKQAMVWLLGHDYLCRSVLELQRRRSYWQYVLDDAHNAFLETSGLLGKCRALLRLVLQIQLACAKLRGRINFGKARGFATLSTIRLFCNSPTLLAVLLVASLLYYYATQQQSNVDRLFKQLGPEAADQDRTSALWVLTRSRYAVRRKVLAEALSSAANAQQFINEHERNRLGRSHSWGSPTVYAAVGLDLRMHDRMVRKVFKPTCELPPKDPEVSLACALMALDSDLPDESDDGVVLHAFETGDASQVRALEDELIARNQRLTDRELEKASKRLVALLNNDGMSDQFMATRAIVSMGGAPLTSSQARVITDMLIAAIQKTEKHYQFALAGALATSVQKLSAAQASAEVDNLVKAIEATTNPAQSYTLGLALREAVDKLSDAQVSTVVDSLLEAIKKTRNPFVLNALKPVLKTAIQKLNSCQAQTEAERLLEQMGNPSSDQWAPSRLEALEGGLDALARNLNTSEAARVSDRLLAICEEEPDHLLAFKETLSVVVKKLNADEQARNVSNRLVSLMAQINRSERNELGRFEQLDALAEELAAVPGKLDDLHAKAVLDDLVTALDSTANSDQLTTLISALTTVMNNKLTDEQAETAADALLSAMAREINESRFRLAFLGEALATRANKLNDGQTEKALNLLMEALENTTEQSELQEIAKPFKSIVSNKATSTQIAKMSERLLGAMKKTRDQDQLTTLGDALATIPPQKLNSSQALEGAALLLTAMDNNANPSQLSSLANDLATISSGKLSLGQARKVSDLLLGAMDDSKNINQLSAFEEALKKIMAGKPDKNQLESTSKSLLRLIEGQAPPNLRDIDKFVGTSILDAPWIANQLLNAVQQDVGNSNPTQPALIEAFVTVLEPLPDDQLGKLSNGLTSLLEKSGNPDQLGTLAQAFSAHPGKLTANVNEKVAFNLLSLMETDKDKLSSAAQTLVKIAPAFDDKQAELVSDRLVHLMRDTTEKSQLDAVGQALSDLMRRFSDNRAQRVSAELLNLMDNAEYHDKLSAFSKPLAASIQNLKNSQAAHEACSHFLGIMEKTTNQDQLATLGRDFLTLLPSLKDDHQKERALSLLSEAMKNEPMPNPLCDSASLLINESTLPKIIDLLKWPTCTNKQRANLMKQIGEVTKEGEAFEISYGEGAPQVSQLKFAAWAEKKSYENLSSPPAEYPDFLVSLK